MSILSNIEDISGTSKKHIEDSIIKFLGEHFIIDGKSTMRLGDDGMYIIDAYADVECSDSIWLRNIGYLTNGYFRWGEVHGYFDARCYKLKSLVGGPVKVMSWYSCAGNKLLTSLEGAPEYVGGRFNCSSCDNIKTLKGAPKEIGDDLDCSYCLALESLEGAPGCIYTSIYSNNCPNLKNINTNNVII